MGAFSSVILAELVTEARTYKAAGTCSGTTWPAWYNWAITGSRPISTDS